MGDDPRDALTAAVLSGYVDPAPTFIVVREKEVAARQLRSSLERARERGLKPKPVAVFVVREGVLLGFDGDWPVVGRLLGLVIERPNLDYEELPELSTYVVREDVLAWYLLGFGVWLAESERCRVPRVVKVEVVGGIIRGTVDLCGRLADVEIKGPHFRRLVWRESTAGPRRTP